MAGQIDEGVMSVTPSPGGSILQLSAASLGHSIGAR